MRTFAFSFCIIIIMFASFYLVIYKPVSDMDEINACEYYKSSEYKIIYKYYKILPDKCLYEYNGEFYRWLKADRLRFIANLNEDLENSEEKGK